LTVKERRDRGGREIAGSVCGVFVQLWWWGRYAPTLRSSELLTHDVEIEILVNNRCGIGYH
jgi:hypothetical protein